MQVVNGTDTYEIMLALAVGGDIPPKRRAAQYRAASSFAVRSFSDARVARISDWFDQVASAGSSILCVEHFYGIGDRLSDCEYEFDDDSYRLAVVNIAGEDVMRVAGEFNDLQSRSPLISLAE